MLPQIRRNNAGLTPFFVPSLWSFSSFIKTGIKNPLSLDITGKFIKFEVNGAFPKIEVVIPAK
ncbi:hypothetical protein BH10ACI3_BH10ACI3_07270 [soil metagenome]